MAGKGITDLDLLVKTWAVDNASKLGISNAKKARVEVVWNRVTFTPLEPKWQLDNQVPKPPNRTVYSSCFRNNTGQKAEHTLRVERTSTASCTTNISSGYTTCRSLGLSLSLPYEVLSATASYGRSVTVNTVEGTTTEQVQTWSVDTAIPSPANTLTRAKVEVKENRRRGQFTLPVAIKGKVIVNFYDQNTPGNHIGMVEEDVHNLLPSYEAERRGNVAIWTLRGTCDFEFGVEQMTTVDHEKIPTELN